MIPCY